MRKLLNGFTLAEVLITLSLIGVVAAITIPTLHVNVQKQRVYPSLLKGINTLKNANKEILSDNNVRSLQQVCGDYGMGRYIACLQARLPVSSVPAGVQYYQYDGSNFFVTTSELAGSGFTTKDGISFIENGTEEYAGAHSQHYYQDIRVYIDINGVVKGPNILGKDLFAVNIDYDGTVVAKGGAQERTYSVADILIMRNDSYAWETTCSRAQVTDARDCTGSVIDNKKVIYY